MDKFNVAVLALTVFLLALAICVLVGIAALLVVRLAPSRPARKRTRRGRSVALTLLLTLLDDREDRAKTSP
jgi:hypothetical protein